MHCFVVSVGYFANWQAIGLTFVIVLHNYPMAVNSKHY